MINQYKTGDLTTRLQNDIPKVIDTLISTIPSAISLLVQLITAFVILSSYDLTIAVIAFVVAPVTLLPVGLLVKNLRNSNQIFKMQSVISTHK